MTVFFVNLSVNNLVVDYSVLHEIMQFSQNYIKLSTLKMYMTQKIFPAYLKGFSKYRRMAFFFLKYLFSF